MFFSAQGGYETVDSGSTCERVKTKAECEEAAKQLCFQDSTIEEESDSNYLPYCYYSKFDGSLFLNYNGNSALECGSKVWGKGFNCICKKGILEHL